MQSKTENSVPACKVSARDIEVAKCLSLVDKINFSNYIGVLLGGFSYYYT